MEKTVVIGDSRNVYRLIRKNEPRRPSANEAHNDLEGSLNRYQEHRLESWTEQFRMLFYVCMLEKCVRDTKRTEKGSRGTRALVNAKKMRISNRVHFVTLFLAMDIDKA